MDRVSVAGALLAAGAVSSIALQHNPQGEYVGPNGRVRLGTLAPLFLGWFGAVLLLVLLAVVLVGAVRRLTRP